jgi:hypothetical protein
MERVKFVGLDAVSSRTHYGLKDNSLKPPIPSYVSDALPSRAEEQPA